MKKTKNHEKFFNEGDEFYPTNDFKTQDRLIPGVYSVGESERKGLFFKEIQTNHDEIINLPSNSFKAVVNGIKTFLKAETKNKFNRHGFLYKRSILVEGLPGTGKTVMVNRVAKEVVDMGGIVLFNPPVYSLSDIYQILNDIQPDVLTMVVFEEFDELIEEYEEEFLSLLDGEVQKNNVVYVMTTNHIEHVPPRMRRPGRISQVVHVDYPSTEERKFYLDRKLEDKTLINNILEKTNGYSIDDLKEVVLATQCLDQTVDEVTNRIDTNRKEADPIEYYEKIKKDDLQARNQERLIREQRRRDIFGN